METTSQVLSGNDLSDEQRQSIDRVSCKSCTKAMMPLSVFCHIALVHDLQETLFQNKQEQEY